MSHATNGYLVRRIKEAKEDTAHEDHGRAEGYLAKFRGLESHFFEHVHPQIDGALIADGVKAAKDGVAPDIMTIHGCRHIIDVVESLDKIAESVGKKQGARQLTTLEAYILLCAAHLHDAGNIGGRAGHPARSGDLIKEHRDHFYDTETAYNIFDVARVHGGESEEFGRDTIREINSDNFSFPRLRMLAAILRLGDELSENAERIPNELVTWLEASPKSNLAYRYAQSFRRFDVQNDNLDIQLRIGPEQHEFVANVEGNAVTFFDHLEHKINVIEKEARYCSQYGRPDFDVRRVRITIEYFHELFPSVRRNMATLSLDLDRGYPGELPSLSARCDELREGVSLADFCRG